MNPYPGRNSIILIDNARIHKGADIRQLVESFGMFYATWCNNAHLGGYFQDVVLNFSPLIPLNGNQSSLPSAQSKPIFEEMEFIQWKHSAVSISNCTAPVA
jgi:hypothetical protein